MKIYLEIKEYLLQTEQMGRIFSKKIILRKNREYGLNVDDKKRLVIFGSSFRILRFYNK